MMMETIVAVLLPPTARHLSSITERFHQWDVVIHVSYHYTNTYMFNPTNIINNAFFAVSFQQITASRT